jgi:exopolyphosphatase/guanosine-5'-triphosphate,3'-diphosphate pyrophosphatase
VLDPSRDIPDPPLRAAIDIGTNTLLALVGRVRAGGVVERVADLATITRLGQGVDRTHRLAPEAMARTLDALREFVAQARALGAVSISAVATSAVRDADNREEFLAAARAIAGPDVEVISGEREAALTFAGAAAGTGLPAGARALVFDVGGGSTELIAGPLGAAPVELRSLDIGSVRLTERCVRGDPPAAEDLACVDQAIAAALADLPPPPPHDVLLGLAGTVTTLAAIARGEHSLAGAAVHGVTLTRGEVARVAARLAALPLVSRRAVPGLDPRRGDVIVAGAAIVRAVMAWAGREALVVSDGGVRIGLLLEQG